MDDLNVTLANNLSVIFIISGIIFIAMFGLVIKLNLDLTKMRERYKRMTAGAEDADIPRILLEHANNINAALEESQKASSNLSRINDVLKRSITRVAVIRYNAFHDDTADLSYSIALLDEENSGVIISSLNGREFTRSYVKPLVKGESPKYKLTKEELQAIQEAAIPPEDRKDDSFAGD